MPLDFPLTASSACSVVPRPFGQKKLRCLGFEPGSAKRHGLPVGPFDRSATCRIKRVLIIWRLDPQCTNSCATKDPRVDPRPGPRLYDYSPNAASSTHAVASAQNPASEFARTAPRPPGGPPPEEADGANYILPPGTSSLSRAEAVPGTPTAPQRRAPRRALVRRPEGRVARAHRWAPLHPYYPAEVPLERGAQEGALPAPRYGRCPSTFL